ncbi:unnamed protein product, partial [Heterotrigona itama]
EKKRLGKEVTSSILNHKRVKREGQRREKKRRRNGERERTWVQFQREEKEARTLRGDLDCASSALLEREGSSEGKKGEGERSTFNLIVTAPGHTAFSCFLQGLGQDVLMGTKEEEWGNALNVRDKSSMGVVLRDRLMTDAALGGPRPIKSEHNYSLLTSSPPPSPATPGANPHTPNSGSSVDRVDASLSATSSSIDPTNLDHHKSLDIRTRIDDRLRDVGFTDMEAECFPTISMNHASDSDELPSSSSASTTSTIILKGRNNLVPEDVECIEIKDEPISAPSSPSEPCRSAMANDKTAITMVFPQSLHFPKNHVSQTSDSEEDDEEYYE